MAGEGSACSLTTVQRRTIKKVASLRNCLSGSPLGLTLSALSVFALAQALVEPGGLRRGRGAQFLAQQLDQAPLAPKCPAAFPCLA
jgi:hypothetical protein